VNWYILKRYDQSQANQPLQLFLWCWNSSETGNIHYNKPLALSIGNDNFRPPHLENRSTDLDETWNYLPKTTRHARPHIAASTWVVWANNQFATVSFFRRLLFISVNVIFVVVVSEQPRAPGGVCVSSRNAVSKSATFWQSRFICGLRQHCAKNTDA